MRNNPLPRLDIDGDTRQRLLPFCRLRPGDIWRDRQGSHRVACIDATDRTSVGQLIDGDLAAIAIQDPPYNLVAFEERQIHDYVEWCKKWVEITASILAGDSALYVWLGADQNNEFQPLPDFMIMMRGISGLKARSFITMRNQRGYGTQCNWMAVRQELLYYTKGNPDFEVQYTDIPKILRGYYKEVNGKTTENLERGKSENIRAGNVWVDVQQVFYRMEENVSGCYAQKPLKSIERIVSASSKQGDLVVDLFAHSGTSLLACERLKRRCYTAEIDPVYCEIVIRRLERYRQQGLTGWQNGHPFEKELGETAGHFLTKFRAQEQTPAICQSTLF
ncbi:MAG: site-specific DNA-methyltransferase [Armatimonadota bacterium]|nr:site-specific DNA-methyltransferase [Armatimonadota bacterium]